MVEDSQSGERTELGPYLKSHHADGDWEVFADRQGVGVRGFGKSRDLSYTEAALALVAAVTEVSPSENTEPINIVCRASSDGALLRHLLTAVSGETVARRQAFTRFAVNSHRHGLTAKAWGREASREEVERFCAIGHQPYAHEHVARDGEGNWMAQCVVDLPVTAE
ncbi:MAG: archease [Alphaproteobacteria bacterium]